MTEQRKSIPWYWWTLAGLLLLVAYPLSAGPAYGLIRPGYITVEMFNCVYAPLGWLCDQMPRSIAKILLWSLHLWIEE